MKKQDGNQKGDSSEPPFCLPGKVKCYRGKRTLRRADTPHEVPVVPIVVVIAVELTITTIVVQVVPICGIVSRSRPPVPVPGIVQRAIVVVATSDSAEPSRKLRDYAHVFTSGRWDVFIRKQSSATRCSPA